MATTVTLKPNAIDISGSTSGTTTLQATAVAGTTTLTLPAATDTLVGKATTDTLTNKTLTGAVMNGTVGATTPSTGSFTSLAYNTTLTGGTGIVNLGSGQFYKDASGLVGVGTASPTVKLQVTTAAAAALPASSGTTLSAGTLIRLGSGADVAGNIGTIGLATNQMWIQATDQTNLAVSYQLLLNPNGGNVGIGTSSPAYKLEVRDTMAVLDGSSNIGFWANGTSYTQIWQTLQSVNDFIIQTAASKYMSFGTNSTERMRVTSDGRFYVNQTAGNGNTAQRAGITYDGATEWALAIKTTEPTGGNSLSFQNSSGTQIGVINHTNTATAYITSSDYRLKQDIAPMIGALAKVALLKPVTYKWKLDGSDAEGFIAHELAEVCPAAVCGAKDATKTVEIKDEEGNVIGIEAQPVYQGIDTSFLVATLTAAIQELTARVAVLEAK